MSGVGVDETLVSPKLDWTTLVDLLRHQADQRPGEVLYRFLLDGESDEEQLPCGLLDHKARAIGALLQDVARAGERALLLYPPGLEFVSAFFGCLFAGLIAVPVYPPNPARPERTLPRFSAIIENARPRLVLTTGSLLSMREYLFARAPELPKMLWLSTDQMEMSLAAGWKQPEISLDTVAFIQYTSGATQSPRGVMVTHGNLLHNGKVFTQAFQHTDESIGVSWLPLYHDMGLIGGIIQPLCVGCPVVLMSPVDFIQRPARWLEAISNYRATVSGGPNFAYDLCVRKITEEQRESLDLSSWTLAFNGAEPVRPQTIDLFSETFGPCGFKRESFYPCYGLAEATLFVSGGIKGKEPVTCTVSAADLSENRVVSAAADGAGRTLVSCGKSWLDLRIIIVDPVSRHQCPPEQIGEIWIAGSSVARGYWDRPEDTQLIFSARMADNDDVPFLRTGDLGFIKEGELFVTGRLSDVIAIADRTYYPQDLELTVEKSHSAIRPCCSAAFLACVDGAERLVIIAEIERRFQPDRKWKASGAGRERPPELERHPADYDQDFNLDPRATLQEITTAISERVMAEHGLAAYRILLLKATSIPKTSSGKVQHHACRTAFLANTLDVIDQND